MVAAMAGQLSPVLRLVLPILRRGRTFSFYVVLILSFEFLTKQTFQILSWEKYFFDVVSHSSHAPTTECGTAGTWQRTTRHGASMTIHPKTLYGLSTRNRGTLQAQVCIQAKQSRRRQTAVTITKAVVSQTKE